MSKSDNTRRIHGSKVDRLGRRQPKPELRRRRTTQSAIRAAIREQV